MQADVGHATGIILLASQVLLQRSYGVPRQYCGRRSGSVRRRLPTFLAQAAHSVAAFGGAPKQGWRLQ